MSGPDRRDVGPPGRGHWAHKAPGWVVPRETGRVFPTGQVPAGLPAILEAAAGHLYPSPNHLWRASLQFKDAGGTV